MTIEQLAEKLPEKDRIIIGGVVGSFNFRMNDELSDVDTRYYTMPTLTDLIQKRKKRHLYFMDNHDIQVHDIRRLPYMIRMGDMNQISILFSREQFTNEKYADLVNTLIEKREEIAESALSSIYSWGRSMFEKKMGQLQTYKVTEAMYQEHGYNTKNACQAVYHLRMVERYMYNLAYNVRNPMMTAIDCSEIREDMMKIKNGAYTLDEFMKIAEDTYAGYANMLIKTTSNTGTLPWLNHTIEEAIRKAVLSEEQTASVAEDATIARRAYNSAETYKKA